MDMSSLDEPAFIRGDGAYDAHEIIMLCGDQGRAHLLALTADFDETAMRADLLALRDRWRDAPDVWVDGVTDCGMAVKERPGAYRWWPRDRLT